MEVRSPHPTSSNLYPLSTTLSWDAGNSMKQSFELEQRKTLVFLFQHQQGRSNLHLVSKSSELGCIDIVPSWCGAEYESEARLMGSVSFWGLLPLVLVFYKTPCQQKAIMQPLVQIFAGYFHARRAPLTR
ncbi:hypothetical protein NC651_027929 [Populus alba x Populus x berolinensis]|nr:hypothetical protein NC651_027929 [Populus alba x Populus x berolinensis]